MILGDSQNTPPSILLWGAFGSGKTAFVETGGSAVQLLDIDQGGKTGLYLKDKWLEQRKKIDWIPLADKPGEPPVAFDNLKAHILSIPSLVKAGKFPWKVVVIDSLTEMCSAAMRKIMALKGQLHLWENASQPEWGLAMIQVKQILQEFRVLPVCKILIAHQEEESVGGAVTLKPKVIGNKLYPEIPPLFDEVHWCKKVMLAGTAEEYRIHTSSTSYYPARSRYAIPSFNMDDGLPRYLELMNYDISGESPAAAPPSGSTAGVPPQTGGVLTSKV